jgi:DNA repair protein RAD5
VDHPLLVLGKGANEAEETDRLLEADAGDETGSLKQMIAAYAGGKGTDNGADDEGGSNADGNYALQVLKELEEAETESECFMCTGEIFDEVLLPCYHRGSVDPADPSRTTSADMCRCQDCIVNYLGSCEDQNKPAKCPVCDKGPISLSDLRSVQRRRKRLNPLTGHVEAETAVTIGKVDLVSSTKLRALARKLETMRAEDPEFKALVFSQFTSFLGMCPAQSG